MRKLEQAVADIFNNAMRERCQSSGTTFHSFSLGGQDRDVGADYLISNAEAFALIEFKNSESELGSEGLKPRRRKLCMDLQANAEMRAIHDKCHFLAWRDSASGELHCAPYRTEICNVRVFPACKALSLRSPEIGNRMLAASYCADFISPPPERCSPKADFERYLAWLMRETSGSKSDTVELMARGSGAFTSLRFTSLDTAYRWMRGVPGFY